MRLTVLVLSALLCFPCVLVSAQGPKGEGPNPEEMKKRLMQQFDTNGNGQIDENEKQAAAAFMQQRTLQMIQSGNIPEELKKRIDRNGDGTIDAQEMALAKEMMGHMQQSGGFGGNGNGGTGEVQIPPDVVKKFDKNKDGKLDDTEKKAALEAMNAKSKSRTQLLKEKLDTNGDGKIDEAEREAAKEAYKNKSKKTDKPETPKQ